MKHSDVFKLSTLATAIVAIMPALATADAVATETDDVTTKIDKPVYREGDGSKNLKSTGGIAIGTTTAPKELKDAVKADGTLNTTEAKDNGVVDGYGLAGVYVSVGDSTVRSATFEGDVEHVVNITTGETKKTDNQSAVSSEYNKIAAALVEGQAGSEKDKNLVRSELIFGKKAADGTVSAISGDVFLKAANKAESGESKEGNFNAAAYGIDARLGGKAVINTTGNATIEAEKTNGGGLAYAVFAHDLGYVDIDAKDLKATATADKGGATALLAIGAAKDFTDKTANPVGIDVKATNITAKATVKDGNAYGVHAKGNKVTLDGDTLEATGTATKGTSIGLIAEGGGTVDASVTGEVTLKATTGASDVDAAGEAARAVYAADGTVNVSGSKITMNSKVLSTTNTAVSNVAYGVHANSDNLGASVTIKGGSAAAEDAYDVAINAKTEGGNAIGIRADGGGTKDKDAVITVNGGKVSVTADTGTKADAANTYKAQAVFAQGTKDKGQGKVTIEGDVLEAKATSEFGKVEALSASSATTDRGGVIDVLSKNVTLNATNSKEGEAHGIYSAASGVVNVGKDGANVASLTINANATKGDASAIYAEDVDKSGNDGGKGQVTVYADAITATVKTTDTRTVEGVVFGNANAIVGTAGDVKLNGGSLLVNATSEKGDAGGVIAQVGGTVDVLSKNVNVEATSKADGGKAYGIKAKAEKLGETNYDGKVTIGAANKPIESLEVTASAKGKAYGLLAEGAPAAGKVGTIDINAKTVTINATVTDEEGIAAGIVALNGGKITGLDKGNVSINQVNQVYSSNNNAVLVDGSTALTVGGANTQLKGDVGYYYATGSVGGANPLTVNLDGKDSSWVGNAKVILDGVASVPASATPNLTIQLSDGATWYVADNGVGVTTPEAQALEDGVALAMTKAVRVGEAAAQATTPTTMQLNPANLALSGGSHVKVGGELKDGTKLADKLEVNELYGKKDAKGNVISAVDGAFDIAGEVVGGEVNTAHVVIGSVAPVPTKGQTNKITANLVVEGDADTFMDTSKVAAENREAVLNDMVKVTDKTSANGTVVEQHVAEGETVGEITRTFTVTGVDESGNWVITGDTGVKEAKNTTLSSVMDTVSVGFQSFRAQMNDVAKRMGDLRNMPQSAGAWGRLIAGQSQYKDTHSTYQTLQIGADGRIAPNAYLGGMVNYTTADGKLNRGSTDDTTWGFGIYGGWMNDDGQYVDVTLKHARVESDFDVFSTKGVKSSGSFGAWGTSISAEYGWRLGLGSKGFYAEPQVEFTYGHLRGDDFTLKTAAGNGARVSVDSMDSAIGRAGVAFGWVSPDKAGSAYVKASVLHDWDAEANMTATASNGIKRDYTEDMGGTWGEFAVGGTYNITKNLSAYGEVETTAGNPVRTTYQLSGGLRYSF